MQPLYTIPKMELHRGLHMYMYMCAGTYVCIYLHESLHIYLSIYISVSIQHM